MSTSAAYGVLHLHQGAHGASNRSGYGQVSGPSGSNRVSDPSGFSGNVVPVRWNAAVRRTPHDLSRQQHAAEIRDSRSIARRSGFNAQTTSMEQLPHAMTDTAIAPRSRVNEYASRASRANAGVPRRGARSRLKELIIEGMAAYDEEQHPCVVEPRESADHQDGAEDWQGPRRACQQDRDGIA
jgi:hypothetical protein